MFRYRTSSLISFLMLFGGVTLAQHHGGGAGGHGLGGFLHAGGGGHFHHSGCGCFGGGFGGSINYGGVNIGYGVAGGGFGLGGIGFGGYGGFGTVGSGVLAQPQPGFAGGGFGGGFLGAQNFGNPFLGPPFMGGGNLGNPLAIQGFDPLRNVFSQPANRMASNFFPSPAAKPAPVKANPAQSARSVEMLTIGDRLFRVGNFSRAVQRYDQATKADPDKAAPLVRLAQVAMVRGKYADAANRIREAQAVEPGWLTTASDVQGLFPEPADFAKQVAKLEAHLQSQPQDRDAWLVLGAEWYLSGRTSKAADVFLRLSDRAEDPTLRAFLNATKANDVANNP